MILVAIQFLNKTGKIFSMTIIVCSMIRNQYGAVLKRTTFARSYMRVSYDVQFSDTDTFSLQVCV